MSGWRHHTGIAVALDRENVDTDQLIPARFMSTPRDAGYGQFLLHDLRFDARGQALDAIPLNRVPGASVLVTRRNFGTGSSREAAVYALVDFGITAVLAPSFGDIFAANAINNGLLPAQVTDAEVDELIGRLPQAGGRAEIDLERCTARIAGLNLTFALDPVRQEKLINGWDDIDLSRQFADEIMTFRNNRTLNQPWAFPTGESAG